MSLADSIRWCEEEARQNRQAASGWRADPWGEADSLDRSAARFELIASQLRRLQEMEEALAEIVSETKRLYLVGRIPPETWFRARAALAADRTEQGGGR